MSRLRSSLIFALCLVWTAAIACASVASLPATHCQRKPMPCCPATGHAHCSADVCAPQTFQKSEAPLATQALVRAVSLFVPAARRIASPPLELFSGPRSSFSVFRLKDDLRI